MVALRRCRRSADGLVDGITLPMFEMGPCVEFACPCFFRVGADHDDWRWGLERLQVDPQHISPEPAGRRLETIDIGIAPARSEDLRTVMPTTIRKYAYVTVISGSKKYTELSLESDVLMIGRGPGVDLVLEEPSASRQHVRITKTPEGHVLRDLGSTNGTYLMGVLHDEERLLEDDDCFKIGATELVYHAGRSGD